MSETAALEAPAKPRTPWRDVGRHLLHVPTGWLSLTVLALLVVVAALGPILARGESARVFEGLHITLLAGLGAAFIAVMFAILWGTVAALSPLGGVMMQIVRLLGALPLILFLVAGASLLPNGTDMRFGVLMAAIAATLWIAPATAARAKIAALWRIDFVEAARAGGVHAPGLLSRHIAPNLSSFFAVAMLDAMAGAVATESALSFLGLGLNRSLGALLGVSAARPETTLLFWAPLALLFATLLSLTLAARCLRAALESAAP